MSTPDVNEHIIDVHCIIIEPCEIIPLKEIGVRFVTIVVISLVESSYLV